MHFLHETSAVWIKIHVLLLCSGQVMEAVHGVTIEEVESALQRNDWNPVRAEQQLKVRPWDNIWCNTTQSKAAYMYSTFQQPGSSEWLI